jgi:hypothetical protein
MHFVLPRPVFATLLNRPARPFSARLDQEVIMTPTILFSIAELSLLTVVATAAQLNEQGVSTPENNGEPHRYNSPTWARGPNPDQPH